MRGRSHNGCTQEKSQENRQSLHRETAGNHSARNPVTSRCLGEAQHQIPRLAMASVDYYVCSDLFRV